MRSDLWVPCLLQVQVADIQINHSAKSCALTDNWSSQEHSLVHAEQDAKHPVIDCFGTGEYGKISLFGVLVIEGSLAYLQVRVF